MRMSASFAADEGADVVAQRNIDEALRELIMRSSKLTKAILGFQSTEKNAADAP
jgi:glucuronate isomerase